MIVHDLAARFLSAVLAQPRLKWLLSSNHFSVAGTLVTPSASMKGFRSVAELGEALTQDEPPPAPATTRPRLLPQRVALNATLASRSDLEGRLYRKCSSMEARPAFFGHALMEKRRNLILGACRTNARGHAEPLAALAMSGLHACTAADHAESSPA